MAGHKSLGIVFCSALLLAALALPTVAQTDYFANSKCYIVIQSALYGEPVWVYGTSTMEVSVGSAGQATDTNGNGLDDVAVQLTTWTFAGYSATYGPVTLYMSSGSPSAGLMEELANNTPGTLDVSPFAPTGQVSSYLDMFLEVQMGGQTLYNTAAKPISGTFYHEPAIQGDTYTNYSSTTLYDSRTELPSGYAITTLIYYLYIPVCGDAQHPYPIGDVNHDCRVNFVDIALLSLHWLECTAPECEELPG